MKHTFRPNPKGSHVRLADSVRGTLREHPDSVTVEPASALVDPADFGPYIEPVAESPVPASEPVREISKLTLRRRLRELGKEAAFDAALDGIPHARADWDDAQTLRTDDPLFTTAAPQFKAALTLTDEQFAALLAS